MPYKTPLQRSYVYDENKALKKRIAELESDLPKTIPEDRDIRWLKESIESDKETLNKLQKLIK